MKKYLLLVLSFTVINSSRSEGKDPSPLRASFDAPESVYYDSTSDSIFVSNVAGGGLEYDGNGWITRLDTDGRVINNKWVKEGLHAPKGMGVYQSVLYVADIQFLVSIDIESARVLKRQLIPGSIILNDIAISPVDGSVYVSDTMGNKIYRVKTDGEIETFAQGEHLEGPNGLKVYGDSLIVASWGTGIRDDWSTEKKGSLYRIDMETLHKTPILKEKGNLDGVEFDLKNPEILYVTDWVEGVIYQIKGKQVVRQIDGFPGAADIGIILNNGHVEVLLPSMKTNQVFRLSF